MEYKDTETDGPVSIEFRNTKQAYRFLADTSTGHAALEQFRSSLNDLHRSIDPSINWGEFLWVLRGLVAGLNAEEPSVIEGGEVVSVGEPHVQLRSGFNISPKE